MSPNDTHPFFEREQVQIQARPETVFRVLSSLAGFDGWFFANKLWRLRGWVDRLLGGPGMRGRSSLILKPGDVMDFYRVEAIEFPRLLRLQSELKAPGKGWLEWSIEPGEGGVLMTQTASFTPLGWPGRLYGKVFWPVYAWILAGLLKSIVQRSAPLAVKQ